jgi:hypothetical protein
MNVSFLCLLIAGAKEIEGERRTVIVEETRVEREESHHEKEVPIRVQRVENASPFLDRH